MNHRFSCPASWGMLLLLLFTLNPGFSAEKNTSQYHFGVIDFRYLLAVHPLMQTFDIQSRRFGHTTSAFVTDRKAFQSELDGKITEADSQMRALEKELKAVMKKGGKSSKSAYNVFWKKKQFLEDMRKVFQEAHEQSGKDYKYQNGITSESTLIPVIQVILSHIRQVAQDLQEEHGLQAVLDVSPFLQAQPPRSYSSSLLQDALPLENTHWKLWKNQALSPTDFTEWRKAVQESQDTLFPEFPDIPVRAGFLDLRNEAVQRLKTYSDPHID